MSNTFITPAAGKSQALSRIDYNETFRSVISLAYGTSPPVSSNFEDEGTVVNPYLGTLHRNSRLNAVYIYDPSRAKGGGIGSGYTRIGIGTRNFESIASLVSNLAFIEQSELLTTVGDSTANYRVYMKVNNSNSIVDIGLPTTSSLSSTMFIDRQISNVRIVAGSITRHEIALNTITGDRLVANTISNTSIAPFTITQDKLSNSISFSSSNAGINIGGGHPIYAGMANNLLRIKSVSVGTVGNPALAFGTSVLTSGDDGTNIALVLHYGTAVGVGVSK